MNVVSKSQFKAKALEFFREIERTGEEIVITDRGKPTLKVVPFKEEPSELLAILRDSVVRYDRPLEPVGEGEWETLREGHHVMGSSPEES